MNLIQRAIRDDQQESERARSSRRDTTLSYKSAPKEQREHSVGAGVDYLVHAVRQNRRPPCRKGCADRYDRGERPHREPVAPLAG